MFFEQPSMNKKLYFLPAVIILLWIILFELILPMNNILPRPSVVLLSFSDLWQNYNLGINYLSTFTIIILSSFFAYFLIWLLRVPFIKSNFLQSPITSLEWFSRYIPGILTGLFLIFWFPDFEYTDGIFALASALFFLFVNTREEIKNFKYEYADSIRSLGAGENFIIKKVMWKSIEPNLMKHFIDLIFYLWTVLIIFEFIKGSHGLGAIIRSTLRYNDLSAFFSILLIIGFSIFVLSFLAKILKKKYYYWEEQ